MSAKIPTVIMFKDTDITGDVLDTWRVGATDYVAGDHIGVVVHTTQNTDRLTMTISLRCVISSIDRDSSGVPVIMVRPADVHTRVLNLEDDAQDFYLQLNDKMVVLKNPFETASPGLVEAALLQTGIDPYYAKGVLFGGQEPQLLPMSELLTMDQVSMNVMGTEIRSGDHIEYKVMLNASWQEARIDALVASGEGPSYLVAITDVETDGSLGCFDYLRPGYFVRPLQRMRTEPVVATPPTPDQNMFEQLSAGMTLHQAIKATEASRHDPSKSLVILDILHVPGDLIDVSSNGTDWSTGRLTGLNYVDGRFEVKVANPIDSEYSHVLSRVYRVRPIEEQRIRRAIAKRAQSVPAGEGAQAYASAGSQFMTAHDDSYAVAEASLKGGVLFGGRTLTDVELVAFLVKPQVKFDIMGITQERGTAFEVSHDRTTWDEVSNQSTVSDGLGGYVVQIRTSRGAVSFITPEMYVRPSEFQRHQRLQHMLKQGTVSLPGAAAYVHKASNPNSIESLVLEGVTVGSLPSPADFLTDKPLSFSLFELPHHQGEQIELFYPTAGVWKIHRIVELRYDDSDSVCNFKISADLKDGNLILSPNDRIRLTEARREHVIRVKRDIELRAFPDRFSRSARGWHAPAPVAKSAGDTRFFGGQLFHFGTPGNPSFPTHDTPTPGMLGGRAFGDHPDTVAAYGHNPYASTAAPSLKGIDHGLVLFELTGENTLLLKDHPHLKGQEECTNFTMYGKVYGQGDLIEVMTKGGEDGLRAVSEGGEWTEVMIHEATNQWKQGKVWFSAYLSNGEIYFRVGTEARVRGNVKHRTKLARKLPEFQTRDAIIAASRPIPGVGGADTKTFLEEHGYQEHPQGPAGDMSYFMERAGITVNKPPYTGKDLMEHTGMAGLALSSMLRGDVVLGEFRQAINQFATGVETLVLGHPGRGFK